MLCFVVELSVVFVVELSVVFCCGVECCVLLWS